MNKNKLTQLLVKPYAWAAFYSIILTAVTLFVLLDTFLIPRIGEIPVYTPAHTDDNVIVDPSDNSSNTEIELSDPVITENSYSDPNIQITIKTERYFDTTVYLADLRISDIKYLKAAFAKSEYGRNIKQETSVIAENNGAIFAINGDYYGFRNYGFVLRNGTLYRSKAGEGNALMVGSDGNFYIVDENSNDANKLWENGSWQIFSFGPTLIENSVLTVSKNSGVDKEMKSNPRTAIGQISELHYLFVVSDGRTDESEGLSLYELAQIMSDYACVTAYNLDGGGSSTMWFMGEVVNIPTDGKSFGERKVSDIVYIGY